MRRPAVGASETPLPRPVWPPIPHVAACAFVAIAIHAPSLWFGFTGTDDKVLLLDQRHALESPSPALLHQPFFPATGGGETYYRPLVTLTFVMDAQWTGIAPARFHLTNVLLHAAAVSLFLVVLARLAVPPMIAAVGTATFAVHPALSEAVAWIPGRCDLLLGIGFLISAIALLDHVRTATSRTLLVSMSGLAVALLSKEAAVAIPAVLAGLLLAVPGGGAVLNRPRLWMGWTVTIGAWLLVRSPVGDLPIEGDRLRSALAHAHALVIHLGKVVFPFELAPLAFIGDSSLGPGAAAALLLGGIAWVSRTRLYVWGIASFVVFLLPTLPVSDFLILENRLYAAAMPLWTGLLAAGTNVAPRHRNASAGVAILLLCAFSLTTVRYGEAFKSPASFTDTAVRTSPRLPLAHLNRGIVLHQEGRLAEAEQEYLTALGLEPRTAVVQNNLGLINLNRGELEAAEALFRAELAINPSYDKAHYNLGLVLDGQGRAKDARASWETALRLNPHNADARDRLERSRAGQPPTLSPVALDRVPTEVLLRLFQDALAREPGNEALRLRYAAICRDRNVPCPGLSPVATARRARARTSR